MTITNLLYKIKKGMIYSFVTGVCCGLFPNKVSISFNNERLNIPLHIIGGCLGLTAFTFSPFLIVNYMFETAYFDKLIDKYNIDVNRFHQYDGNNNKYAIPSTIIVKISSFKNKNNNKNILDDIND